MGDGQGEVGRGKRRCVGHLRVTIGHCSFHLRVSIGYIRVTIGYLKGYVGHLRIGGVHHWFTL